MGLLLLIALTACHPAPGYSEETDALLDSLDYLIERQGELISEKETSLSRLSTERSTTTDPAKRFDLTLRLTEAYRPYRFDSALHNARLATTMAGNLGAEQLGRALTETAYCYLSAGRFLEAARAIQAIPRGELSVTAVTELHRLMMKYYFDLADYNSHNEEMATKYRKQGLLEADSAFARLPEGTKKRDLVRIHQSIYSHHTEEAHRLIADFLKRPDGSKQERAIVLSLEGKLAAAEGDEVGAIRALAQSAAYDLMTGTRETTSMAQLATELYRIGDIDRAGRYIDQAMADANFYDAKHRKMTIGDIRPLIEQSRLRSIEVERRQMMNFTISVSLLCLLLLVAIVIIVIQMRRLRESSRIIVERNDALALSNERLEEANAIKDQYIGSSFDRRADHIREQDELYAFVLKRLESKQYDAIRRRLSRSEVVRERKDMYADFDQTFLELFPTFVTEWNRLFPPEEQVELLPGDEMTPEMRIFALIRVGITKTDRIARFLNYSVNTINTYKTRVKNRSIVPNKDFESEIMKIGRGG